METLKLIKEAPESNELSEANNIHKEQSKGSEILKIIPEFQGIDTKITEKFFSTESFCNESQYQNPNVLFYINYTDLNGTRLVYPNPDRDPFIADNKRENLIFHRERLTDEPDRKYTQPKGSPRFPFLGGLVAFKDTIDKSKPLIIVEGEKKAFLLCSKNIPAIGIPGINGFYRNTNESGRHLLNETFSDLGIVKLIENHKPGIILLHDGDALEGANDRKAPFYSSVKVFLELLKPLNHCLSYCMVKPDIKGKGIDDAYLLNTGMEFEKLVNEYPLLSSENLKEIYGLFFPSKKPMKPSEIAKFLSDSNKYISNGVQLFEYKNDYWQKIPENGFLEKEIAERIGMDASRAKIMDTLYLLGVNTRKEEMNIGAREDKFTVLNGVLDIQSGELLEHSPEYLNTFKFNVFFDETATCPRWLKFLDEIFQHDDDKDQKIQFLQCFFGLCLTTNTSFQKAVLLAGDGSNGKGVLLHVISSILEPAQVCLTLQELGQPNSVQRLVGKTFCYNPDLPKSSFNEGAFKAAVCGEPIPMKILYKDAFSSKVFAKFCFATNSLPTTKDLTDAYFRRWVIIEFNECFTGHEDYNLKEKLMCEIPGIFNWMLKGLKDLKSRGNLPIPVSSDRAVSAYLKETSSVESYISISERIKIEVGVKESCQEIYASYIKYCLESGFKCPLTRTHFYKEFVKRANITKDRGNGNQLYFEGVRLLR